VIAVSHPLTRVAAAYTSAVTNRSAEEWKAILSLGKTAEDDEEVSFKDFVRYLTDAGRLSTQAEDLKETLLDEDFNRPWASYGKDCPVCHPGKLASVQYNPVTINSSPDLFPTFVIKADSPYAEEEVDYLKEVFDLEDVSFPAIEIFSQKKTVELYAQLTERELEKLIDLYSVDMHMYAYSPSAFYDMLK